MTKYLYLLLALFFASSCNSIVKNGLGINEPTANRAKIAAFARKIPIKAYYYLQKDKYLDFIKENIADTNMVQKFCQPLQVLSFKNGILRSMSVNCNARGFPNLKWRFQTDSLGGFIGNMQRIPAQFGIQNYLSACGAGDVLYDTENQIVVQWSYVTGRQTQLMIRKLQKIYPKQNIIYINNDALYVEQKE